MSKAKKKIYGSLLGIAALVAIIDLLTGKPAVSDAAVMPMVDEAVEVQSRIADVDEPEAKDEGPLFPFARQVDQDGSLRNPFLPPKALRFEPKGERRVEYDFDPSGPPTVEMFIETHELSGVLLAGEAGVAIVNDTAVDIGQAIDRAVLLGVESNAARFQCADGVAVLRVIED